MVRIIEKVQSILTRINQVEIVFPADFLAQCASFGHGALRGIMYLKTMNTPLEGIVLPPVVYGEMFKKPISFDKKIEE